MVRLYCSQSLFPNQLLTLNEGQLHYLRNVLRLAAGQQVTVFNEQDGELTAVIAALTKKGLSLKVEAPLRPAVLCPPVSLAFALLKHTALTFLIEKATELGVRSFHPIRTERCNISKLNSARLLQTAIDAAQQCERFDIPCIHPLLSLSQALAAWNRDVPLYVCQERDYGESSQQGNKALSLREAFQALPAGQPLGFLIGPEGGFSASEMAYLKNFAFLRFITLGPRILRAETAALAALAGYQAYAGG